jgi:8-oxo-dGTP pyrophosphatase MutT (NUDIX family)
MARYQVLYWKHIPAQVKVSEEGKRPLSRPLSDCFQIEIDRVATQEGLTGTDAYLEQWRWTPKRERPGTAEEVADALIRELEEETKI